jgi:hypothetical protein
MSSVIDIPISIGTIALNDNPIVKQPVPSMLPQVIATAPPVNNETPSARFQRNIRIQMELMRKFFIFSAR